MGYKVKDELDLSYEKTFWDSGVEHVVGIDEVGRGCFAGPVVVAGVKWSSKIAHLGGVQDSKKLSFNVREELCELILDNADVQVALVPVDIIDEINILQATFHAMHQVCERFDTIDHVIIDGRDIPPDIIISSESLVKGDAKCYSIAAASIVAKVVRDRMMMELHDSYEVYDWLNNKGYGTKKHREAILKHGPTKHHRMSFLKKLLG